MTDQTLQTLLRHNGKLPEKEAVTLLDSIAAALQKAHNTGQLHNNLKPEFIHIRSDHTVTLSDFGMLHADDTSQRLSAATGAIPYLSPELLTESHPASPRSDQYGLAVIAFEIVTGRLPFEGSVTDILQGHINQAPPDLRGFAPNISAAYADAVLKALSKNPADRFEHVTDFVAAMSGS